MCKIGTARFCYCLMAETFNKVRNSSYLLHLFGEYETESESCNDQIKSAEMLKEAELSSSELWPKLNPVHALLLSVLLLYLTITVTHVFS